MLRIREELDASLLVIEHDMPFIMSISDRVYCLEAGRVIAEGTPTEVRDDPAVVASYLGTDQRAIQRSGAAELMKQQPGGHPMSVRSFRRWIAVLTAIGLLAVGCSTSRQDQHVVRRGKERQRGRQ